MDALANSSIPFLLKAFIEDRFPVAFPASGGLLLSNHFQINGSTIVNKCLHLKCTWTSLIFYLFYQINWARTWSLSSISAQRLQYILRICSKIAQLRQFGIVLVFLATVICPVLVCTFSTWSSLWKNCAPTKQ